MVGFEGSPPAPVASTQADYKSEMHRVAAEATGLHGHQLDVLVLLYYAPYYKRYVAGDVDENDFELFRHFVTRGVNENLSPNPFFDPVFCATVMELEPEQPILLKWLRQGMSAGIIPTPMFDARYYLSKYPDIAEAAFEPFLHFLAFGQSEGRIPCENLSRFGPLLGVNTANHISWLEFLTLIPAGHETTLAEESELETLKAFIQPDFYRAQVGRGIDKQEVYVHFFSAGLKAGYRPTLFFNEEYYRHQLKRLIENNDAQHDGQLQGDTPFSPTLTPIAKGVSPFLHWFCVGRPNRVVPTPLFDEGFYKARYPDLRIWKGWVFEHYINHGSPKERRQASDVFDPDFYCKQRSEMVYETPLLDFVLVGEAEGAVPSATINYGLCAEGGELKTTTRIERCAMMLEGKIRQLEKPIFRSLIEHAAGIEPMVLRPYGRREFQWPPYKHSTISTVNALASVRRSIPRTHYDTVVLIPHCRMAGSARVAGALVSAIWSLYPNESLLLVMTDLSEFQRPDWFGAGIELFDLSGHIAVLNPDAQKTALLDLIRGLKPKRVINVNSRLAWEVTQLYGQQISTWTDLYAYLFTWDLDRNGNKGGYPINWFYPSFDSLKGVFVDNSVLMEEMAARYAMPEKLRKKIHLLHTPAEPIKFSYSGIFQERRRRGKRLRCFWAGRFDAQKRFDVVIEIARLMPEMDIMVWGKTVLGGIDIDFDNLPANIKLQGVYKDFDDLPIEACDFFLYTAQWDGLPTILIDVGTREIPIVGSRVGGTADLISETTAWPVDDVLEPDAYVEAIKTLCANPEEGARRAAALRKHTLDLCNDACYRAALHAALTEK